MYTIQQGLPRTIDTSILTIPRWNALHIIRKKVKDIFREQRKLSGGRGLVFLSSRQGGVHGLCTNNYAVRCTNDGSIQIGAVNASASGLQTGHHIAARMAVKVMRPNGNNGLVGLGLGEKGGCGGRTAAVMPGFQNVALKREAACGQIGFLIGFGVPGEQKSRPPAAQTGHHAGIVGRAVRFRFGLRFAVGGGQDVERDAIPTGQTLPPSRRLYRNPAHPRHFEILRDEGRARRFAIVEEQADIKTA